MALLGKWPGGADDIRGHVIRLYDFDLQASGYQVGLFLHKETRFSFLHSCCWYSGLAFLSHTKPTNSNTGQRISTRKRIWAEVKYESNRDTGPTEPAAVPAWIHLFWHVIRKVTVRYILTSVLKVLAKPIYISSFTFCLLRRVQFFHSNRRICEPVFIVPRFNPWKGSSDGENLQVQNATPLVLTFTEQWCNWWPNNSPVHLPHVWADFILLCIIMILYLYIYIFLPRQE